MLTDPSSPTADNRFQVLNHDQVERLHAMLETNLELHSRNPGQPVVQMSLRRLVKLVREGLAEAGVSVRDTRLNGGAASYIIGMSDEANFNDIDLLFGVELNDAETLATIKSVVLRALLDFLPHDGAASPCRSSDSSLAATPPSSPSPDRWRCALLPARTESQLSEAYLSKLVRVQTPWRDSWYLLGLGRNAPGVKSVELKFVHRMRRQFEFSVDSFQIILDTLLTFADISAQPITQHFYPTVVAEAVSGSFPEALRHLQHKLISTRKPEEIRGGGLLRYCRLLVEGYVPDASMEVSGLERYMCSRFFIDFADLSSQRNRLLAYLANHFADNDALQVTYLETLRSVVAHSTVCLMGHERRQTLYLIDDLITQVVAQIRARTSIVQLEEFNTDKWVLDQVFYGWGHFPRGYCHPPPPSSAPSACDVYCSVSGSGDSDDCTFSYCGSFRPLPEAASCA